VLQQAPAPGVGLFEQLPPSRVLQRVERHEVGRVLRRLAGQPPAGRKPPLKPRQGRPASVVVPDDHFAVQHRTGRQMTGQRLAQIRWQRGIIKSLGMPG